MIEDKIKSIIEEKVKELGYTYLSVSFLKENSNDVLRVTVDRDESISLDDIVKVNEVISPLIDEADLIKGRYMLDVTTLGVEKPIEVSSLEKYVDKYINIHINNPYKGLNILEGYLREVSDKEICLEYFVKGKKTKALIERNNISKARIAIKF